MSIKKLIIETYEQNHNDVDVVLIIMEKLNDQWERKGSSSRVICFRGMYDVVFGQMTEYQTREAFRNLFQHDNETTIEHVIERMIIAMIQHPEERNKSTVSTFLGS